MKKQLIVFCFASFLFFATPVSAQCTLGPSGNECPASGIIQVQQLIRRMVNISVTIAFIAVTVWLVWSAVKLFIVSGGEPKALAQAWSSVTWIFMGLFFMVLAYLTLKLIAGFTGADVTGYCLGFPPYCV